MAHQSRAEETHARILAAAMELFTRYGYDATGVAEICARADVSKGAFYHHFPSKQAVFLALFLKWVGALDAAMQVTSQPGQSASERLAAMAGMVERVLTDAKGQIFMFLEFLRQAAKDQEVWQVTLEPYRRFRSAFSTLVAGGIAEGSLRPVDPDMAAHVLVSLGLGLVLQGALDPAGSGRRGVADQAIRLLLDGLSDSRVGKGVL